MLPPFATSFAAFTGDTWVPLMQPGLIYINIKLSALEFIMQAYLDKIYEHAL